MREKLKVREITNDEGSGLPRIVRRSSGSVVTWCRAIAQIAGVAFTSEDRVRAV